MPIRSTIQPGSVYYFPDSCLSPSEAPHFFIVINLNPLTDNVLLLLCSHSNVEQIKRMRSLHPGTTVEIGPKNYRDFPRPSIIDCNTVFLKTIKELTAKHDNGKLELRR